MHEPLRTVAHRQEKAQEKTMRLTTEVKTNNDIANGTAHIANDKGMNWEYCVGGHDITTASMAAGIVQSQIAATLTSQILYQLHENEKVTLQLTVELIEK